MRVVEFLGPPGSGKSTLAAEILATRPESAGLHDATRTAVAHRGRDPLTRIAARLARSGSGRLWNAAYARSTDRFAALERFISSHPEVMAAVISGQRERTTRDRGQATVLGWVLNLMARYQLATEEQGPGWLVLDEGFAQRAVALFSFGFSEEDQPALETYLRAIPVPDLTVLVETPADECARRLDHQGWSQRVAELDGVARRRFLDDATIVAGLIASRLEANAASVLRVSGVGPLAENSLAITATFDR